MRTRSLHLPATLAVLALGLLLNGVVRAGDLLEEAKARKAVEAQRVERLVADAKDEATRLARSRPAAAVEVLQDALATLEKDTALKADTRETLIRRVKLQLKYLEGDARDRRLGLPPPDTGRSGRVEEERRQAETNAIRRSQAEIRDLRDAGRIDEARRNYEDLARRFPGKPSIQAGSTIGSRADQIAQQKDLTRQRAENTLMVYLSVDKSRKIPLGEVEFPADWLEKVKRRSKNVNITEKEQAILKALNTVISVDFDKSGFQGVIDFLEKKTGQSIIIDKQAMNEANVTYDTPLTMKAKTTTRTVLRRVLADLNLAYIIKDEAIQVTSIQKAKETLSARTYYVGDLVGFGGGMGFGGYIGRQQMALQIQQLATLITQVVEPESWAVNGGSGLGTIAFEPITMSFVVRQTAEIHYLLGIGLR